MKRKGKDIIKNGNSINRIFKNNLEKLFILYINLLYKTYKVESARTLNK